MTRQGALCGNINYANGKFWASEHAVVVSPVRETDYIWLGEMLRSMNLNQYSVSAAQPGLAVERIRNLSIAVPPLNHQLSISRFLVRFTDRINRFIRNKRRLIALLTEQKQAIIQQAVTRGLNPDVPLKPSGVEGLGEIPAHWEVGAVRRFCNIVDCKHLTVPFVDDGILLASVRQVNAFELDLSEARMTTRHWYDNLISGGRKPQKNDLIYCRNVNVGSCALVVTDDEFALGQDVCLIRSNLNQRFLNYVLHSQFMQFQLAATSIGSTFKRINIGQIYALNIIVPPKVEQDSISAMLDVRCIEIDKVIARIEREILLIREYRTRLVADVVTGQIDVRKLAASLPEENANSGLGLGVLDTTDWDGEFDEAEGDELGNEELVEA